jgi:uncharacterized protein (TIGR02145 family)
VGYLLKMKKTIVIICLVALTFSCKKSKDDTSILKTEVEIGTQIWTTSNYLHNGTDLFTYEDAKKLTAPTGYRLPTKEDWAKLFNYLGYTPNYYTSTVNTNPRIINTFMEGEYNVIKGLLSTDDWGVVNGVKIKGTNSTGFNSKPNASMYFVSDPVYGNCELFNDGFYMGVFDKDPRAYSNGYPLKYSVRFVKNK